MKEEAGKCKYAMAYTVQFANLREDLVELKERVGRLETTLGRGVMLLVANLAGMVATLVQQFFKG